MRVDIGAWLRGLGLEQYQRAFRANNIDGEIMLRLTAEDLAALGVGSVGHRRKLLAAINTLSGEARPRRRSRLAAGARPGPAAAPIPGHEAERRQLTVMFVDMVGSTALSGRLDPEEMGEVLAAYQDAVSAEVARLGGHVAKFMGDGVLAYFGWPRAYEDAAERAVRAGLAAAAAVGRLRTGGGEALAARVGIATGLVVVGHLVRRGAARRRPWSARRPTSSPGCKGWPSRAGWPWPRARGGSSAACSSSRPCRQPSSRIYPSRCRSTACSGRAGPRAASRPCTAPGSPRWSGARTSWP
jgi:class 3 adenylate cyclase